MLLYYLNGSLQFILLDAQYFAQKLGVYGDLSYYLLSWLLFAVVIHVK